MKPPLFSFTSWSKTPDLRAFLAWRLAGVVETWWQESLASPSLDRAKRFEPKVLALRRIRGDRPIYGSAIALHLSHQISVAPATPQAERLLQLAQELAIVWNRVVENQEPGAQRALDPWGQHLGQHCLAEAMPNGMMALQVTDAGLAAWLDFLGKGDQMWGDQEWGDQMWGDQMWGDRSVGCPAAHLPALEWRSLERLPVEPTASQSPLNAKMLFTVQAAHARCCSLLGLAESAGLVRRVFEPGAGGRTGTQAIGLAIGLAIAPPDPVPWLHADQTLRCRHPAEQRLIGQLLTTFEMLCPQPASFAQILRSAADLAQALQQFDAACRIFGEVKTELPELAQARLGLVWVTRRVLEQMLSRGLNAIAPTEL